MATCRHAGPDSPRLLNGRHTDECEATDCKGCQPCTDGHCAICSKAHTDHAHPVACPHCVGVLREDLYAVADLTTHLGAHAVQANGGRLAAAPIPGGEAMVLLAPTAVGHPQWFYELHPPDEDHAGGPRAPAAPGWVLANWRAEWQLLSDAPSAGERSVAASVVYLVTELSRMAQRESARVAELARDVSAARYHLEEVLHDGDRNEPGAPCVHCGTALVRVPAPARPCACVKAWVPHAPHRPGVACIRCRQEERHAAHAQGGLGDMWQCLRCRRRYTEQEYRYAVNVTYLMHSPHLTAAQLSLKTGVAVGTLRVWAHRGLIDTAGHDNDGRILYDVASCEARVATPEGAPELEPVVG